MTALIFDTETTDLNSPIIIEAAGVYCDMHNGRYVEGPSFNDRFNPGVPISLAAMAIHHIMDEDLVDQPPASSFKFPDGVLYLIGHNVDFDWAVAGKPDVKRICTRALSQMLWPEGSHSLVAMMYRLERYRARDMAKNAHSALADVRMCQILLDHIIDKANASSLDQLHELSERARIPTVMPFGKHKGEAISSMPADYKAWLRKQPDIDPYLLAAL